MRALVVLPLLVACTNNEPQYVSCPTNADAVAALPNEVCSVTGGMVDAMGEIVPAKASLHVPVKPESMWKKADRDRRMELQTLVDMTSPGIVVPVYRPEHYELSVEWVVHNLEPVASTFRINLSGANEEWAYDPTMIMVDDEAPKPPPLLGNIPIDIEPMGTVSGVFREDQMREAAIDLDQITRGNINMFRATLTVNKNDEFFQPVTPVMIDPATGDPIGGEPDGPKVPKDAWRQLIRVDIDFRSERMMTIEYALRIREKVEVIHEEGLNAPMSELNIIDPADYQAVLP